MWKAMQDRRARVKRAQAEMEGRIGEVLRAALMAAGLMFFGIAAWVLAIKDWVM